MPALLRLPDELLEAIVYHLPASDAVAFGNACRRTNKITSDPLIWRRHCIALWRYWERPQDLARKLELPPTQTNWRQLYNERAAVDSKSRTLFDELLLTQQNRYQRMEEIAARGYNVKDLLLSLKNETPDTAEDVLARRYHAAAILGQIHRGKALDQWISLQQGQAVKLEEALGAYDLFVFAGEKGDLGDIADELDAIAQRLRERHAGVDDFTVRRKAVKLAEFLRSENLVGNPNVNDYHALRNNFISMALFDQVHTSLPLQSAAIYCAVARRLGVNAEPSNYPGHVHVVIETSPGQTLNGRSEAPVPGNPPEVMYMDPWNTSDEVSLETLRARLSQMGVAWDPQAHQVGATSTVEMVLRTGRNILTSVEQARHRQRLTSRLTYPDTEVAWYSMLWSMVVLGDSEPLTAMHRRRQVLPILLEHYQIQFPNDLPLIERIPPHLSSEREPPVLAEFVATARAADRQSKVPCRRHNTDQVLWRVGHLFRHLRYGYEGFIVGWDAHCAAEPDWISQMHVDDLPGGRGQPFYNVVAEDKSTRYVAQENILRAREGPSEALMQLAGRYFKRWDEDTRMFESNLKDEYPDD